MKFNEGQTKAINIKQGNAVVVAGSGSGKSGVICERIKTLIKDGVPEGNILAITFSKEAEQSLVNRLQDIKVTVKTFHALAFAIIKKFGDKQYELWSQFWQKENVLFNTAKHLGVCFKQSELPVNEIMKFIGTQKHHMRDEDNLMKCSDMPYSLEIMKEFYHDYEAHKQKNNLIEFDDMLNLAIKTLENKPNILAQLSQKFKYILADEFQDVSLNQVVFLQMLNKPNQNLFVVGDASQAIYAFRSGDSKYMMDFENYFGKAEIVNLYMNYRSTEAIVKSANKLIDHMPERDNPKYKPAEANKKGGEKPVVIPYQDTQTEAEGVCKMIKDLHDKGYEYKNIAILSRTNAYLQSFESVFAKEKIPYQTYNGKTFLDNPEIKLVVSYLLLADNEYDDDSFIYIFNKPNTNRFLPNAFIETLSSYGARNLYTAMSKVRERKYQSGIAEIEDVISTLRSDSFDNVGDKIKWLRKRLKIDSFVSRGNFDKEDNVCEQIESLNRFEESCRKLKSMAQFKLWIKLIKENSAKNTKDKVKIMTAHKSKGLEFPVVFVVGACDTMFPHSKCENPVDDLKLFYVACTRPEEKLFITRPMVFKDNCVSASPFIDYMEDLVEKEGYKK